MKLTKAEEIDIDPAAGEVLHLSNPCDDNTLKIE